MEVTYERLPSSTLYAAGCPIPEPMLFDDKTSTPTIYGYRTTSTMDSCPWLNSMSNLDKIHVHPRTLDMHDSLPLVRSAPYTCIVRGEDLDLNVRGWCVSEVTFYMPSNKSIKQILEAHVVKHPLYLYVPNPSKQIPQAKITLTAGQVLANQLEIIEARHGKKVTTRSMSEPENAPLIVYTDGPSRVKIPGYKVITALQHY